MAEIIHIGTPPIPIMISRSERARRYSLRISNKDGKARLTVPKYSDVDAAIRFAMSQEVWLRKHLAKYTPQKALKVGDILVVEGQELAISAGQGRAVKIQDGRLLVPGRPEQLSAKLRGYLKARARDRLVPLSDHYASKLGQKIGKVTLRDTTSRWGSCTSDKNLMYSWRLILAPPRVLEYVAAHEACHLVEMNHSDRYWALVASIFPDYNEQRAWLRRHGTSLHQIDFS